MNVRTAWRHEDGVFVPALMGVGILVSAATLLADGLARVAPLRRERTRAARAAAVAEARAVDLLAATRGAAPSAVTVVRQRRPRRHALAAATVATLAAVLVVRATLGAYDAPSGLLADRGWTLAFGFSLASVCGGLGAFWLTCGALAQRPVRWIDRAVQLPLLGSPVPPATRIRSWPDAPNRRFL